MSGLVKKKVVARVWIYVLAERHGKDNSVHVVDLIGVAEAQVVRIGGAPAGGVKFSHCVVLDVAVQTKVVRMSITVYWLVKA